MKGWLAATLMGTCLMSGITIGVAITAPKLPQSSPKNYTNVAFCNLKNNIAAHVMVSWREGANNMIVHETDVSYSLPEFTTYPNFDYKRFTVIEVKTKKIVANYSDCSRQKYEIQ